MEHERGERRAKLLHLIFVNICNELKCRDNRKEILKKERKTWHSNSCECQLEVAGEEFVSICPPECWRERGKRENSKQRACHPWEDTLMCMCVRVCDWERANANARTTEPLHKLPYFHGRRASATPLFTYIGLVERHEHSEVGEVAAGAGGVSAVCVQQPAAQRRPLARHRALRIVPKGAIWSMVIIQLWRE